MACALLNKDRTPRRDLTVFRPAQRSRHARGARRRRDRRLFRRLCGRPLGVQRGHRGARAKAAHRPAARRLCVRRARRRQGDQSPSPALGRRGLLEYGLGARANGEDLIIIEPQASDYWPKRRRSTMPTRSSCRGSRTCGGAATDGPGIAARRRRCSNFAIRACGPHRHAVDPATSQATASAGRFSGDRSFSRSWSIAKCFSSSKRDRRPARPKATTTSCYGTFTISLFHTRSTKRPAYQPAGRFIRMPARLRRCRRCGPAGPARRSICANSRQPPRRQSHRSQQFCANGIRCAVSTTRARSRFQNFPAFSTMHRACPSEVGQPGPVLKTAV